MGNQDLDPVGFRPHPDDDLELPDDWQYDLTPPDVDREMLGLLDHIRAEVMARRVLGLGIATVSREADGETCVGNGYHRGKAPIGLLIAGTQYLAGRLVNHVE